MRWGMGWGCPWGDPETWTITLAIEDYRTGVAITFLAVYGQYYQLVIDGRLSGVPLWVGAGETKTMSGYYAYASAPHTVSVVGCGPWATAGLFDVTATQIAFLSGRSERIHLELVGAVEQFSAEDDGQLTNWQVNGIKRFSNCRPVDNLTTWGELDFTLITVDDVHTLELTLGGTVVARGSRVGNGTIILSEVNGSGVAAMGTNRVDLVYSHDIRVTPVQNEFGGEVGNEQDQPIFAG